MALVGSLFLLYGDPPRLALMAALFVMAAQSTYLTPAKYGLLADLYPQVEIAKVNAWMQVLGYLAIVLGAATGGWMLGRETPHSGWICGFFLVTAALGVIAAHFLADPSEQTASSVDASHVQAPLGTRVIRFLKTVRSHRRLSDALIVYGVLWLIAGVYQPIVNLFCRQQLQLSPWGTSVMLSLSVVGIASGCGVAMLRRRYGWSVPYLQLCVMGVVACQFTLSALASTSVTASAVLLTLMGVLTGAVVLPLHVTIQVKSPAEIRGRVLATQGFVNWVAILTAGAAYQTLSWLADQMGWLPSVLFLPVAAGTLMVACGLRGTGDALIRLPHWSARSN